jgi:hypothetical protein
VGQISWQATPAEHSPGRGAAPAPSRSIHPEILPFVWQNLHRGAFHLHQRLCRYFQNSRQKLFCYLCVSGHDAFTVVRTKSLDVLSRQQKRAYYDGGKLDEPRERRKTAHDGAKTPIMLILTQILIGLAFIAIVKTGRLTACPYLYGYCWRGMDLRHHSVQ